MLAHLRRIHFPQAALLVGLLIRAMSVIIGLVKNR
jgi:hypothetical protein